MIDVLRKGYWIKARQQVTITWFLIPKKSPNHNRTHKFQKEQESQKAHSLTVLNTNVTPWRCMTQELNL